MNNKLYMPVEFLPNNIVVSSSKETGTIVISKSYIYNYDEVVDAFKNVVLTVDGIKKILYSVFSANPEEYTTASTRLSELLNKINTIEEVEIKTDYSYPISVAGIDPDITNNINRLELTGDIDINHVGKLFKNIKNLDIYDIDKYNIEDIYKYFPNITELRLDGDCSYESVSKILECYKNIKKLDIQFNDLNILNLLDKFEDLEYLKIKCYEIEKIPEILRNIKKLIHLDLSETQIDKPTFLLCKEVGETMPNIKSFFGPNMI